MSYQVIVRPGAEKAILRLNEPDYEAVIQRIRALAENPRPKPVKKLTGTQLWRLRIRDYRVIYSIDDDRKIVRVLRVARRKEDTYRGI